MTYSAAGQAADDGITMKNKQKSRTGCRTCKLRRLRCDETKPGCRNCLQKGFDCPGYQQRLQWSTKHEKPTAARTSGPANFTQLVTAASESIIVSRPANAAEDSDRDGTKTLPMIPVSTTRLSVPAITLSACASPSPSRSMSPWPSSASSASTSTPSPPYHYEDPAAVVETHVALPSVLPSVVPSALPSVVPSLPSVVPKIEPGSPDEVAQRPELILLQPVVDIPTFLIEHWFNSVCSSWSALDSPSNPYRRLTERFWQTSTPVFYALQSISAASLVERFPHVMRDTARLAPRNATEAITKELMTFFTGSRPEFPTELLLSLFCMSSSMCWMESHHLGQQFVRQARAVLRKLDGWTLDAEQRELLDFFNGCLVYEEMLRSVVSEEEIDFEHMLSWPEPVAPRPLVPPAPHPWTGVPSDVLRLFGKSTALCRRSRTRWRQNNGTSYRILQDALRDIEAATKVEEALRAVAIPPLRDYGQVPLTVDRDRDLHYLTEAYRLCGLLQLYETFPDLSTKQVPTLKDADGSVLWDSWVSPLALHITDVLSKVPTGSLSCIQPLLCLCAGSGLRYDTKVPLGTGHRSYLLSKDPSTVSTPMTPPPFGPADSDFPLPIPLPSPIISENAVKTSQARQVIMDRLDRLELSLPPKPIEVAKKLQRAVWGAYDEEIGLTRRTHWLDVMSYTGLHSIFG